MSGERAHSIPTPGGDLPAIFHPGGHNAPIGVLILVGGPQYRVGSHRQFVQLARALAAAGVPVLRFDHGGMGDAPGERKAFDRLDDQVRAAVDLLMVESPGLRGVVLWGLCDGASAALLHGPGDARVAGLVLVNPWLESTRAHAQTRLRDYYLRRLTSGGFWRKLLSGGIDLRGSIQELGGSVREATSGCEPGSEDDYQSRMLLAFETFDRPLTWLLSGNDLTAGEFWRHYSEDPGWVAAADAARVRTQWLEGADHTFSRRAWKQWLAERTLAFVGDLGCRGAGG